VLQPSPPPPGSAAASSPGASPSALAPTASAEREPLPKLERRVFRQVVVGPITRGRATRLTWILSSGSARTDLDIYCQTTTPTGPGLRLTGEEQNDAIWADAMRVSYFSPTLKAASSGKEIEYVFASRPAPAKTPCWAPRSMRSICPVIDPHSRRGRSIDEGPLPPDASQPADVGHG